eukprot:gnl/MRDRNA2_/MRDRNA2_365740_c0_seq1.p1 gnl/MRDRNA2_/MRDRNA2_365740_c0~~gnl/MRDRNA2_/MRDRNA2_365740_c0_seq1.p1  ORF type:complete len:323 (+),score=54.94 gnl/MRDRNA2_/MRDRNA2_365740_c0_seq1:73-969(+)
MVDSSVMSKPSAKWESLGSGHTGCVVMSDNRSVPLVSTSYDVDDISYLSLSVAANSLYAQRHGYQFLMYNFSGSGCIHPTLKKQIPMTWCKVQALQDALLVRACDLVLLLDSDAVVSAVDHSIEAFLVSVGAKDATVTLSSLDKETMALDPEFRWNELGIPRDDHSLMQFSTEGRGNFLNAGVMVWQRTSEVRAMLDAWWEYSTAKPPPAPARKQSQTCWGNCIKNWPHEQAVFELFVWPRFRQFVKVLPLRELNSPQGRFCRHVWGARSRQRRKVLGQALQAMSSAVVVPKVPQVRI